MAVARLAIAHLLHALRQPAIYVAAAIGVAIALAAMTLDVLAIDASSTRSASIALGASDLAGSLLCVFLAATGIGSDIASDWTGAIASLRHGSGPVVAGRIASACTTAILSQSLVLLWLLISLHDTSSIALCMYTTCISLLCLSGWTALCAVWLGPVPAVLLGAVAFAASRALGSSPIGVLLPSPSALGASPALLAQATLAALAPAFLAVASAKRLLAAGP